jgi:DNA-binding NtrC family response regulator
MKRGTFRGDLFYRLNVFALHLPPLRQRREDIPLLADAFLKRSGRSAGTEPKRLTEDAIEAMQAYDWPGNVRELENALERAVILTEGETIDLGALPERVSVRRAEPIVSDRPASANPALDVIERAYIMWVLQSEGGNKSRAAEILGIDVSTLYRKLSRYGVEV